MVACLVFLLQLTGVFTLTLVFAHLLLRGAPHLSAKIGLLGIVGGIICLLVFIVDLPRPWELSTSPKHHVGASTTTFATPATHTADSPDKTTSAQLDLAALIQHAISSKLPENTQTYPWKNTCLYVVLGFSLLWLARLAGGMAQLYRLHQGSTLLASHPDTRFRLWLQENADTAQIQLRLSSRIPSPCVSWLYARSIYLPDDFLHWSFVEKTTAVAHEIAHIERKDAAVRLLSDVLAWPLSIHPLVFLVKRQLITAQELATDRQAAKLMGSRIQYRRGLSLLALRMDTSAQHRFSFQVSITTNSVVRRIKMLRANTSSGSKLKSHAMLGSFLLLSLLCICWNVRADEPLRVASRVGRSVEVASNLFADRPHEPWTILGNQAGYLSIRPYELEQHDFWRQIWSGYRQQLQDEFGIQLAELGLDAQNIDSIATNLQASVKLIPPNERDDPDDKFSGSVGANSLYLNGRQEIDWPAVAEAIRKIDLTEFNKSEDPASAAAVSAMQHFLCQYLILQGKNSELSLFANSNDDSEEVEMDVALKAAIQCVDGGALCGGHLVSQADLNQVLPELSAEDDPFHLAPIAIKLHSVAFGIDFDPSVKQHVRFALVPNQDISPGEIKNMLLEAIKNASNVPIPAGTGREESEALQQLAQDLRGSKIELVSQNGLEIIVVDTVLNANIGHVMRALGEDSHEDGGDTNAATKHEPEET